MDTLWSIGYAQTYFTHPVWLSNIAFVTLIYLLILLTKWGLRPINMLSCLRGGRVICLFSTPYTCLMDNKDQTNVAMPFVLAMYPTL